MNRKKVKKQKQIWMANPRETHDWLDVVFPVEFNRMMIHLGNIHSEFTRTLCILVGDGGGGKSEK